MKIKFFTALVTAIIIADVGALGALAAPATPTSVTVENKSLANTATNAAVAEVAWVPSSGAIAYSVSAVAEGETTRIGSSASCTATKCTSTVGELSGGIEYAFTVTAIASDASQKSATSVAFTAQSIPGNPGLGSTSTGNGSVTLNWTAPSNVGGTPILDYSITDGANISKTAAATKTSLAITGLTAGLNYKFTIKARNAIGSSSGADFSQVTAAAVPSAPAAPSVSVSSTSVTVSWTAPTSNSSDITGYKVILIDAGGNDVGQPTSATSTSTTLSGVAAGTYTAKVIATNGLGDSDRSAASSSFTVTAGTQDNTPVLTPSTIANMDIGGTQTVSAISPSGGDVTFSITASPAGSCTIANRVITAVAPGTCNLTATVAATTGFASGTITKTFQVKTAQTISFYAIPDQNLPGPILVAATSSSGLTVSLTAQGACSVSGRTVMLLSVGVCTLIAQQVGNANYGSAQSVTRSFAISAATAGGGGGGGGFGGFGGGGGGGGIVNPGPGQAPATQKNYFVTSLVTAAAKSIVLASKTTNSAVLLGKAVSAKIAGLKKGTVVVTTIRMSNGTTFVLPVTKVGLSGTFKTPAIKLKKKGTHKISINYGNTTKILLVKVR